MFTDCVEIALARPVAIVQVSKGACLRRFQSFFPPNLAVKYFNPGYAAKSGSSLQRGVLAMTTAGTTPCKK